MNKVIYNTSNLFSLKKYNDGNLNCQSYEYPTIYSIRCAILSSVIQLEGVEKAQELFYKIKNAIIYVQYPKEFKRNNIKLKRYANSYYSLKDEDKLNRDKLVGSNFNTTMGFRQYYYIPQIVFYIDDSIPDLELYLKNIDWLGTAESMVYLHGIEKNNELENIMVGWNKDINKCIYEQYDWDTKTEFDTVYMYSDKYKHIHKKIVCMVDNLSIS